MEVGEGGGKGVWRWGREGGRGYGGGGGRGEGVWRWGREGKGVLRWGKEGDYIPIDTLSPPE